MVVGRQAVACAAQSLRPGTLQLAASLRKFLTVFVVQLPLV